LDAAESALTISGLSAPDPRTSEDCLFLDVITPKSIFNEKCEDKAGAPVLVWIYGGGYVNGDKTSSGNPATLISRSQNGGEGVVYVAMNYRVGLFVNVSGFKLILYCLTRCRGGSQALHSRRVVGSQTLVFMTKGLLLNGCRNTSISSVETPNE